MIRGVARWTLVQVRNWPLPGRYPEHVRTCPDVANVVLGTLFDCHCTSFSILSVLRCRMIGLVGFKVFSGSRPIMAGTCFGHISGTSQPIPKLFNNGLWDHHTIHLVVFEAKSVQWSLGCPEFLQIFENRVRHGTTEKIEFVHYCVGPLAKSVRHHINKMLITFSDQLTSSCGLRQSCWAQHLLSESQTWCCLDVINAT